MIKDFDFKKLKDIELEDIDLSDYPDFVDAFLASATYEGRELDENELEWIQENCMDDLYPLISAEGVECMHDSAEFYNDMVNER